MARNPPPTRPTIGPAKSSLQASSESAHNLVGGLRGRNRQAPISAANPPYYGRTKGACSALDPVSAFFDLIAHSPRHDRNRGCGVFRRGLSVIFAGGHYSNTRPRG